MIKAAQRVEAIQAPSFSDLFAAKKKYTDRTGQEVIDFSIGSSNIPPKAEVKEAMAAAVRKDSSYQYCLSPSAEMVAAIQHWYKTRYDVNLAPEEIFTLKGSQEALSHIPLAFCDPGDLVLIPDPFYPIYGVSPMLAGAEIHYMPLKKENRYLIDFDAIPEEVARQAKLMYVSYPNNPTGALADDAFYERLIAFAKKYDILVLHDNAYSELIFDEKPGKSFLSYPGAKEVGFELNSFSKSYSLGGARMAVMVGHPEALAIYRKLMNTIDFGVFFAVQDTAIYALENAADFVAQVRDEYRRRRDYLIEQFAAAGWQIEAPAGTMFVWAEIPASWSDSKAFSDALLEQAGVLTNPGTSFGQEGARFVRLALVRDDEEVAEAARRIRQSGLFAAAD